VVTAGAWINDLVAPPLPVRRDRERRLLFRAVDRRAMPALVSFERPMEAAKRELPMGGPRNRRNLFLRAGRPLHGIRRLRTTRTGG